MQFPMAYRTAISLESREYYPRSDENNRLQTRHHQALRTVNMDSDWPRHIEFRHGRLCQPYKR
jgi:hypothetical protein